MSTQLELDGVAVAYRDVEILTGISFSVSRGQIACLLGPSGCGKTTLLRVIAGFEPVTQGLVRLQGSVTSAVGLTIPPEQRHVGVVFQDYALFPHLSVAANLAFGLRGQGRNAIRSRVMKLLDIVGLSGFGPRYPHELSGGQQQRVALARALAPEPALLLVDEPFSNLDATWRENLAHELRSIIKETQTTAIFVTHDQQEAFLMADVIGVFGAGRLQQWADARTLYHAPGNRFVANFVGQGSILKGRRIEGGRLETPLGTLILPTAAHGREPESMEILVRPHQLRLVAWEPPNARVIRKAFRGFDTLYTLRLPTGEDVLALTSTEADYAVGSAVHVSLATGEPIILS